MYFMLLNNNIGYIVIVSLYIQNEMRETMFATFFYPTSIHYKHVNNKHTYAMAHAHKLKLCIRIMQLCLFLFR